MLGQQKGAKEYAKEVAALLNDPDPNTRLAAIRVLGQQKGAKEYAKEVAALLNDPDPNTRKAAMQVLVQKGAKEYAKEVAALLNDPDPYTRQAAMQVLGQMGAKEYAKEVAALLKDPNIRRAAVVALGGMWAEEEANASPYSYPDPHTLEARRVFAVTHSLAVNVLESLGPVGVDTGTAFLEMSYHNNDVLHIMRFYFYYFCGGSDDAKVLGRWLNRVQGSAIPSLERENGVAVLDVMERAWPHTQGQDRTRDEVARSIADVVKATGGWDTDDLGRLRRLHGLLHEAGSNHAAVIQERIRSLERWDWTQLVTKRGSLVFLVHAAFWAVLILLYPKSQSVQAFFFWNPWPRRFWDSLTSAGCCGMCRSSGPGCSRRSATCSSPRRT